MPLDTKINLEPKWVGDENGGNWSCPVGTRIPDTLFPGWSCIPDPTPRSDVCGLGGRGTRSHESNPHPPSLVLTLTSRPLLHKIHLHALNGINTLHSLTPGPIRPLGCPHE